MADEACNPILAESSDAPATWFGGAGDLRRSVAHAAHQSGQAVDHSGEGVAQRVVRGTRLHFQRQVAAGDGFGNCRHLLQVGDHLVEGAGQFADFVVAGRVDVVFEIAGIADAARHIHQVRERFGNRLRRAVCDRDAERQSEHRAQKRNDDGRRRRAFRPTCGVPQRVCGSHRPRRRARRSSSSPRRKHPSASSKSAIRRRWRCRNRRLCAYQSGAERTLCPMPAPVAATLASEVLTWSELARFLP